MFGGCLNQFEVIFKASTSTSSSSASSAEAAAAAAAAAAGQKQSNKIEWKRRKAGFSEAFKIAFGNLRRKVALKKRLRWFSDQEKARMRGKFFFQTKGLRFQSNQELELDYALAGPFYKAGKRILHRSVPPGPNVTKILSLIRTANLDSLIAPCLVG